MRPIWMLALPALVFYAVVAAPTTASAQAATSDPRAVALAKQAILALTGGTPVADVMLTGTATRIAGSDQRSGTATLKALGTQRSRLDLSFDVPFSEVRDYVAWSSQALAADQKWHAITYDNSWTDAVWFFPALSSLTQTSNPAFAFSYQGLETRNGKSVAHITVFQPNAAKAPGARAIFRHLSTIDFYLDSVSSLPVAADFTMHPDDNASIDIPIEIHFSNYQTIQGIQTPLRIQRYVNNGLSLDIGISGVVVNSGISPSDFSVSAN